MCSLPPLDLNQAPPQGYRKNGRIRVRPIPASRSTGRMSPSEALSAGAACPVAAQQCYHCGLPVPAGSDFELVGRDGVRRFCCPGCEAVSRSISELGLDDYYRLRETAAARLAERPVEPGVFDNPAVAARYVSDL